MSLDVSAGGEGLASLDNEQVLGVDIWVLWQIVLLSSDKNTLTEEVLVDLLAVGLWNKPVNISSYSYFRSAREWRRETTELQKAESQR